MTMMFSGSGPVVTSEGWPVRAGTLVRNRETRDIAAVRWISSSPFYSSGHYTWPLTPDQKWEDMLLKVDVWRLGEQRMWRGHEVEVVLDPDTGRPPERYEA